MCRANDNCSTCPLKEEHLGTFCTNISDDSLVNKKIATVEKWSKEHPIKTRMSEFLKQYPKVRISETEKFPSIKPCYLDTSIKDKLCESSLRCNVCREKYWLEEIE